MLPFLIGGKTGSTVGIQYEKAGLLIGEVSGDGYCASVVDAIDANEVLAGVIGSRKRDRLESPGTRVVGEVAEGARGVLRVAPHAGCYAVIIDREELGGDPRRNGLRVIDQRYIAAGVANEAMATGRCTDGNAVVIDPAGIQRRSTYTVVSGGPHS